MVQRELEDRATSTGRVGGQGGPEDKGCGGGGGLLVVLLEEELVAAHSIVLEGGDKEGPDLRFHAVASAGA